jgi:hypothetical protein
MDAVEQYRIWQKWIEDCMSSDNLTEWEDNFINSVKRQLERKGTLSTAQAETLERIYAEKSKL